MSTVNQKVQYLQQLQSLMTQVAQLHERATSLSQVFVDRAYDGAAVDPITAADLAPFGLAPDGAPPNDSTFYLGAAINLCQAISALCAGQAVAASAAFPVALSKWRQV